jgi:uncharacterized cofD-like protein
MAATPIDITGQVRGIDEADPGRLTAVRGQVELARTSGQLVSISLDPPDPPACPEAVAAVRAADWVILGPGSWYTSVIPHLILPDLRAALVQTGARVIVVLNLGEQTGETSGYGPEDHLSALFEHAPGLRVHIVLADARYVTDRSALEMAIAAWGAQLVVADIAADDDTARHDAEKLAVAYARIMDVETAL